MIPKHETRRFVPAAWLIAAVAIMTPLSGCGGGSGRIPVPPASGVNVHDVLAKVLTQTGVPAISGAYITTKEIKFEALGIREVGRSGPTNTVTNDDLFQVNSNLKAATSTLAARLVEAGKIRFDSTLAEIFPDIAPQMNPAFRPVTLEQLLDHRGGVVPLETLDELNGFSFASSGTPRERRLAFVREALKRAPSTTVGTYHYSNGGYAVAGAMLEAAANLDFTALMQREVFGPLGGQYRYGYPRAYGANQPIGHFDDTTVFTPSDARDYAPDSLVVLEPAGVASLNTRDYAAFVQMHLRGLQGQNTLLKAATLRRLHTPKPTGQPNELGGPQTYAFGWEEVTLNGVRTIAHYGSDDTFFSVAIIQPSRGVAAYAMTNAGGERGYNAINEAATKLLGIPNPFASAATNGKKSGSKA